MAHHPPRLLVVLVLVLFHVSASHGSPPSLTSYIDSTACSESFVCGSVNISYPFFLSSATEAAANHTNYSCGYTDLKIFCQGEGENKTPILQLGRDKYTVQEIYYGNRTIVLADTEALAGGKCTIVSHNVTLGHWWLSYVNSSFDRLTFFSDCDPLPEVEKYQINCTGFNNPPDAGPGSRGRVSFVFASEEYSISRGRVSFVFAFVFQNSYVTLASRPGGPILRLDANVSVVVKSIGDRSVTVSLADLEVPSPCPIVDHNVTLPQPSWLYFPDNGTVDYLDFFLDCSFTSEIPKPDEISPITCRSADTPSFVFPENRVPLGNWSQACKIVRVPVLKYDPDDANRPGWSVGGYNKVLRQGFQLAWNVSKQTCNRCEQSQGRCGYNEATEFIGCLCQDGRVTSDNCNSASGDGYSRNKRKIYIIAGSSTTLLLCLLSLLGYKKYGSKRKSKETSRMESFIQKNGAIHPKRYTYAQVKRMTKSFAEKLGQGGFGVVYRGALADGRLIAVKMIKDYKTDGEDFINEVASISRTSHVNVVTLLGFCLEGSKRALIYDYMPNGSLERYAFKDNSKGESTLSWEKLFDIAVGIARGLEYLHRGCNTRIVHFDIKPHNILLDQDFCPKISDFGLAKLCLNNESAISIGGARGTIGYIAPEVFSKQFGAVSSKSDVYSYGMMVLEMVGARDKNINANSESSSQYFPQWVYDHLDEYCVSASEINGEITEIVRKMIVVGLWCIQLSATNRPTMSRVVEMLEGSTSGLELPPQELLSR